MTGPANTDNGGVATVSSPQENSGTRGWHPLAAQRCGSPRPAGLCAKIGLFQSSRSVFGQARHFCTKPIAGDSNHALSRKRRCWQGTDIEDRHPEHRYLAISKSAHRAAGLRPIICGAPVARCLEPFSEHRFLLARGHGSAYHQRDQNGYSAASGGAPRLHDGAEAEGYRSGA
jgi:hypothetical protein